MGNQSNYQQLFHLSCLSNRYIRRQLSTKGSICRLSFSPTHDESYKGHVIMRFIVSRSIGRNIFTTPPGRLRAISVNPCGISLLTSLSTAHNWNILWKRGLDHCVVLRLRYNLIPITRFLIFVPSNTFSQSGSHMILLRSLKDFVVTSFFLMWPSLHQVVQHRLEKMCCI